MAPPSLLVKQQPLIGKRPRSDEQGSSSSTTFNGNRSTGIGGQRGGARDRNDREPRKDVPRKDVPRKDVPRKNLPRKEVKGHATWLFGYNHGHYCCTLSVLLYYYCCCVCWLVLDFELTI